mgnify:CR=1 FL=1
MDKSLTEVLNLVKHNNISPEEAYELIFGKDRISGSQQNIPVQTSASNEKRNNDKVERAKEFLREIISRETKMPKEKIQENTTFDLFGLDSFMITRLNKKLEDLFGDLPKTLFFEYRTLLDLTGYFLENFRDKILEKTGVKQDEAPKTILYSEDTNTVRDEISVTKEIGNIVKYKSKFDTEQAKNQPIAIIGLSGRYPMAADLSTFWENLKAGRDCITEIPEDRWDYKKYFSSNKNETGKSYSKWGGFIENIDKFDPLFFNISPKEAELMDPQERLFLQVAWETIEDAGYTRQYLSKVSTGVFVGVMYGEYQLLGLEEYQKGNNASVWQFYSSIANRVSYIFNLGGPSMSVDTMCSSSLTSIHLACESIKNGECDIAIAGGVNLSLHPNKYLMLSQYKFLSSEGKCRSFGEGGDGYVPGEGVGAVLLKPLNKAIEDRDNIHGIIKATSLNHGGRTNGFTVPNPNAQANLISAALKKSGINPRTLSYLEAHGTGTALGDPIEVAGLKKAFEAYTKERQYCPIGSIKSNIGHLESAVGIAAVTKVLLQLKHKKLLPSILSEQINSNINLKDSPFYVQHHYEEWKNPVIDIDGEERSYPRTAGISSFGAGGSNAHVIVQEHQAPANYGEIHNKDTGLFVLSAKNEERLKTYCGKFIDFFENIYKLPNKELYTFRNIAFTLQIGREALDERIAILSGDIQAVTERLRKYVNGEEFIEGLFAGSIKVGIKLGDQYGSNDNYSSTISPEAEKLYIDASRWVVGEDVDFKAYYENTDLPMKISLPTYPFSQKSYWVPKGENRPSYEDVIMPGTFRLHPMIDKNTSTFWEQKYSTQFTGQEFFIKDHIVSGKKLLPGAAFIEMAQAACKIAGELNSIDSISDIVWMRPLAVNDEPKNIELVLRPGDRAIEFEVKGKENYVDVTYSKGRVKAHNNGKEAFESRIDIDSIKNNCVNMLEEEKCYKLFAQYGLEYGPGFRTIKEIYFAKEECMSFLVLPAWLESDFDDYVLHPSIVDGAFQTVMGLIVKDDGNNKDVYLGEITIVKPLQKQCIVYVVFTDHQNNDQSSKKFNIEIADKDGFVIAKISNFVLKRSLKAANINKEANKTALDDTDILNIFNSLHFGEISAEEAAIKMGVK